jgi:hypothetical protein
MSEAHSIYSPDLLPPGMQTKSSTARARLDALPVDWDFLLAIDQLGHAIVERLWRDAHPANTEVIRWDTQVAVPGMSMEYSNDGDVQSLVVTADSNTWTLVAPEDDPSIDGRLKDPRFQACLRLISYEMLGFLATRDALTHPYYY